LFDVRNRIIPEFAHGSTPLKLSEVLAVKTAFKTAGLFFVCTFAVLSISFPSHTAGKVQDINSVFM
jgi:hypothetical protein